MTQPSSRERILEWKVKVLEDRLAIAYSRLEDAELDAWCEEGQDAADAWEEERNWLFGPEDEAWAARRKAWRKRPGYERAMTAIEEMLNTRLKAIRLKRAA